MQYIMYWLLWLLWLIIINLFILFLFSRSVAPQWALASYSCIIGKTEFVNARKNEVKWTLYAGSSSFDESNLQKMNNTQIADIAQIYTYPQVFFWETFWWLELCGLIKVFCFCFCFRQNISTSSIREMLFYWNWRDR